MPPFTAELAGFVAVGLALGVVAILVDPAIRNRRRRNALARAVRHAAQGCEACLTRVRLAALDTLELEDLTCRVRNEAGSVAPMAALVLAIVVTGVVYASPTVAAADLYAAATAILEGAHR